MDDLTAFRRQRCLVTGARGFIGSAVVRSLSCVGAELSAPTRAELDVRDAQSVEAHVRQYSPQYVFHLAAEGVNQPTSLAQLRLSNVEGTKNLVIALSRLPVPPRVVLLGSGFEYAPKEDALVETDAIAPFSDYGISKVEACALARQEGLSLPVVWVRLFNVYGGDEPGARLLPYLASRAAQRLPVELTAGEQLRDFTYVDDVAEGLLRLALNLSAQPSWEAYNLGSGQAVRLRDFIGEGTAALREHGLSPDVHFGAKPYRSGEPMKYLPDISKLRGRLGWSPPTPLAAGVRAAVASLLRT